MEYDEESLSSALIIADCITILSLQSIKKPEFIMGIFPYYALYCKSVEEYVNPELLNTLTTQSIKDIRNSIKLFINSAGKSSKIILKADEIEDNFYRNSLITAPYVSFDNYYNLGVTFDRYGHIIGNTQWISISHQMAGVDTNNRNEYSFNNGFTLGKFISNFWSNIFGPLPSNLLTVNTDHMVFYYKDYNSNKNNLFRKTYNKETNLFLLHILSSIGFIKYVVQPMLPEENEWSFRIKYISTYYAVCGLDKIKASILSMGDTDFAASLEKIAQYRFTVFSSEFRNCMMHYGLSGKDGSVLSEEYFDINTPLLGLVESCFNGKSFFEYNHQIDGIIDEIENLLSGCFYVDTNQLIPADD